jgi:hypothetical protein|tara:strand:- start:202 stop:390 length:189 start_codon:yes stop_codon:yes gene_type:complete
MINTFIAAPSSREANWVAARILFPFSFYFNQQDGVRFLAFSGLSLGLKTSQTVADISESLIN